MRNLIPFVILKLLVSGIMIRRIGFYIVVSTAPLVIKWDLKNYVSISLTISKNLIIDTIGICGSWQTTDRRHPVNEYPEFLLGEWAIDGTCIGMAKVSHLFGTP